MQYNARSMSKKQSLVFKQAAPVCGNGPSERHARSCIPVSPSMARQLQTCRTVPRYTWAHGNSGKSVISANPGDSVSGACRGEIRCAKRSHARPTRSYDREAIDLCSKQCSFANRNFSQVFGTRLHDRCLTLHDSNLQHIEHNT